MKQLELSKFEIKMSGRSNGSLANAKSERNLSHLRQLAEANRNNLEFKLKCSARSKGKLNGMYGKTHNAEARAKISAVQKGRIHSDKSKQKRKETMLKRYGKTVIAKATYTFEGLHCRDWLDKNKDLVESLTYQRGKRTERHKVIEHMMLICPLVTKNYLSVQICNWSKKNA